MDAILVYSVLLVATSLVPGPIGMSGLPYMLAAVVLGAGFLWFALRLFRTPDSKSMRQAGKVLFTYSLSYLSILFLALIVDRALVLLAVSL